MEYPNILVLFDVFSESNQTPSVMCEFFSMDENDNKIVIVILILVLLRLKQVPFCWGSLNQS